MRTDLVPKKKVCWPIPPADLDFFLLMHVDDKQQHQQQNQGFPLTTDPNGAESTAAQAMRRTSQKGSNGNLDGSDSPISRNGTPSMYNHSLPSFMVDDPYQSGFNGADGRAGSPMNGDRGMDAPQTHEQLIAHNSSLKTRVSELEVINELFRGRLSQLEQQEAAARRGQEVAGVEQSQLRSQLEASKESEMHLCGQLEDSHRRENNLKRRLDELELVLRSLAGPSEPDNDRPTKKARLSEDMDTTESIDPATDPALKAETPDVVAQDDNMDTTDSAEAEAEVIDETTDPIPEAEELPIPIVETVEPVETVETIAV